MFRKGILAQSGMDLSKERTLRRDDEPDSNRKRQRDDDGDEMLMEPDLPEQDSDSDEDGRTAAENLHSDDLSMSVAALNAAGDAEPDLGVPTLQQALDNVQLAEYQWAGDLAEQDDDPVEDPGADLEGDTTTAVDLQQLQALASAAVQTLNEPPPTPFGPDQSQVVPIVQNKWTGQTISMQELEMALFCQLTGMSRADFTSLRQIFRSSTDPSISSLPQSVDTLKLHLKSILPSLQLRSVEIPLLTAKMPTSKATTGLLHYIEPIEMFRRMLASDLKDKLHLGMAEFVDEPVEIWQSNAWASSIRTTSGDFARYPNTIAPAATTASATAGKKVQATAADVDWSEFIGQPGGPVFPADFVRFKCLDQACGCRSAPASATAMHIGRVLATGINKSAQAGGQLDQKVAKVQLIVPPTLLRVEQRQEFFDREDAKQPAPKELFLVEGQNQFVVEADLQPFEGVIAVHYEFESQIKPSDQPSQLHDYFIRRILTVPSHENAKGDYPQGRLRPVWQAHAIRGELEIMHFSRRYLLANFVGDNVISAPFINFIDGFGLYRNMHRSLTGFYAIFAGLSFHERNRRTNVIPLTLGPHASNMDGLVSAVGPSLRQLDAGVEMEVPGRTGKSFVCAFPLFYIGDMPQQQENSGMLSQNATYGCRFCTVHKDQRGQLNFDVLANGRFHHETERIRRHIEAGKAAEAAATAQSGTGGPARKKKKGVDTRLAEISAEPTIEEQDELVATKTARNRFAQQQGMDVNAPPLQKLSPALDIINTRPSDPAHSEYQGLTQLVHSLFMKQILTPKALLEYNAQLRKFQFPPGISRLQSPLHYLLSYTLSEHAKWSIVAPALLRTWLRDDHIQPQFREAVMGMKDVTDLLQKAGVQPQAISASMIVVRVLASMARSNMNLMSNKLTAQQRLEFYREMKAYRKMFQDLYECGAVAAENKPQSRANSPRRPSSSRTTTTRSSRRTSTSATATATDSPESMSLGNAPTPTDQGDEQVPILETEEKKRAVDYRAIIKRPNVHIGLHYDSVIAEYGFASNCNVLMGEDKHREFKREIYNTNLQNPERDLLLRQCLEMSVRLVLQNGYPESTLTPQIQQIMQQNPRLLDKILPRAERGNNADDLSVLDGAQTIADDPNHQDVLTGDRLVAKHVKDHLVLPVKNNGMENAFRTALIDAYQRDYNLSNTGQTANPIAIHWWRRFGFNDSQSQRRVVLRRGDFVQYRVPNAAGTRFGRIDQIFTHHGIATVTPRLFVMVTPVVATSQRDPVLELGTYKVKKVTTGAKARIVGLPQLAGQKIWMVPVRRNANAPLEMGIGPNALDLQDDDELLYVDWDVQWL